MGGRDNQGAGTDTARSVRSAWTCSVSMRRTSWGFPITQARVPRAAAQRICSSTTRSYPSRKNISRKLRANRLFLAMSPCGTRARETNTVMSPSSLENAATTSLCSSRAAQKSRSGAGKGSSAEEVRGQ